MTDEAHVDTGPGASDAEQIRDLYARYSFAYDQGRADEYAALFTEDGVFEVVGGPEVQGREALAGMVSAAAALPARTLHMVSNVLVTVTGDSATGQAYVQLLALADAALRVVTVGTYDDTFVRTATRWQLSRRRFEPTVGPDPLGIRLAGGPSEADR
ncbi:nuclear transport factor 2 family protein [Streptomyces sp. NPDC005336]|uniref:nuclear transport factor 2 family protein n=1 Tax=Streptomyces sp. NPDC005336 TaxID=3157035 RepID=UPI0033BBDE5A